jgi:AGZA family xanthine/uracil permease-like MFS transporter
MALLANYPIAVVPAMGHNFFFALTVCAPVAVGGLRYRFETAPGAVFLGGVLFVLLSLTGAREAILRSIPTSLQHAIAAGIGLFVALIGLE